MTGTINHDEAFELAQLKQHDSNLARCYLDLKAQLALLPSAQKECIAELALLKIAVDALARLSKLGNEPHLGNSIGNTIAQRALAEINALLPKAEPEQQP